MRMSLDTAHVLLVEDESGIAKAVKVMLEANGASVATAASGKGALDLFGTERFHLIVLDLGLPDQDGKQLIKSIRDASEVPVIVLSARGREEDRVEALDLGADDYVTKPFASGELIARVRAALRRTKISRPTRSILRFEGMDVDLDRRRVVLQGEEISLSGREHALVKVLAEQAGRPVTYKDIVRAVWGQDSAVDRQFVRVLAGQVRQKIEADPARPTLLRTEPGAGL
jgi:two-component system KDP operon response regulator KdpE